MSKFQSFVYSSNFSIFCVTETWLCDFVSDGEILPVNYVLYRKDRPSRGGGVLVATRQSVISSIIPSPSDLEIVCIKIGLHNDLALCCIYVPPESSSSYISLLIHFLTHLVSSFSKCIILGDFNFPDIVCSTLMGTSNSSNSFCNFVFECDLNQHVLEPTHVKGNILDLILTSSNVSVSNLTIHPLSVINFSDHFAISFDYSCHTSSSVESIPGYVFDFCKADYNGISSFLLDIDFGAVFESTNIEFIWFFIKSVIYQAMSLYIPKMLLKRRQDPVWFNSEKRHHLKRLRTMKRRFRFHATPPLKSKIHQLDDFLQQKLILAKSNYETRLIETYQSSNSSKIFSYIRSLSTQNMLPSTLYLENILATTDFEKASLFNLYFHSVFTKSAFQLPQLNELDLPESFICDINVSESNVFNILQSLDVSKAMGCDGISPKLLKQCSLSLYRPLHYLFSLSLSQSYLPLEWRTHLIKPIFKSGDKNSVKNYRPISLLPVVSKVLEKLVYNRIVDFISSSISSSQYGFLRGRSTLQQLLVFFNTIFSSPFPIDVVYLDFRKAFDSVAHNELLLKLWKFGITGTLWLWLRAYLTNRVQCVSVGQSISPTLPVISGVPQGSILGPLLFLIFVNDLTSSVSFSKILLFADDVKCLLPISSLQDYIYLQSDLTAISNWCTSWNLLLNENKCSIVHFRANNNSTLLQYNLNGKIIPSKAKVKDLGLTFSTDLNWQHHYQLITSGAYKILGLLRRAFSSHVSVSAKRCLYVSLVRSKLLFCTPLWHPYLLKDVKCLELVQIRATRFIINNPTLDYKDRLIQLNILPLMMEFEIAGIIFLIKSIKFPSNHFNIYNFIEFSHHNTRASSYYKLKHSLHKN